MLTHEEFASLALIGKPSTYGPPTVVPSEHSARLSRWVLLPIFRESYA
jgi:hypothetical protein